MKPLHNWNLTPMEALAPQKQLRAQVVWQPLPDRLELVAGAAISYHGTPNDAST